MTTEEENTIHMNSPKSSRARKRRRIKTPAHLSIEMILRKSFCESFKEYVQHCSLAGARKMCDPTLGWFQRIMWGLVFCAALATICYFLMYIWSDTLAKPLIVTMESSTFPISSIDFPAVVICNINRISKTALTKFAVEEYPDLAQHGESLEEVEEMVLNWGRLITFAYNESLSNKPMYNKMVQKYRLDNQRIVQIMRMLAPSCEDMLLSCSWGGAKVDCQSIFSLRRIGNRGHCCTFNYWSSKQSLSIKRQSEPGHLYGLNVFLDPMLDDYAYPLNNVLGFDIFILDPAHFADPNAGRVIQRMCEPNKSVFLELKSTKQEATQEVRKYNVKTRKCLFHDEDNKDVYDVYSYSTCIVFCRINTIYSLCKCTPYFLAMKDYQKGPVCTLENVKCLNKYKEKLYYLYPLDTEDTRGLELEFQDSLYCPDCLPDCELTQYVTKSFEIPLSTPFKDKDYRSSFVGNFNLTNKIFLSIYHPLPDANLDRLDVVYYWFEILSNIGGFCGIIVGFSVISAVEIIYFLTIRLLAHFYKNYKKFY